MPMSLAGAKRWSVKKPHTYLLQVVITVQGVEMDAENTTIAFRQTHWDPNHGLFLDGEHLHLRGKI
jgi:beta-galactosidase/beta-glucuronidase